MPVISPRIGPTDSLKWERSGRHSVPGGPRFPMIQARRTPSIQSCEKDPQGLPETAVHNAAKRPPESENTNRTPGVPNGPRSTPSSNKAGGPCFRLGVGGVQGFGPKTGKMPIFTVFRRRPSISRAWQKRFAFFETSIAGAVPFSDCETQGASEGFHCTEGSRDSRMDSVKRDQKGTAHQ